MLEFVPVTGITDIPNMRMATTAMRINKNEKYLNGV